VLWCDVQELTQRNASVHSDKSAAEKEIELKRARRKAGAGADGKRDRRRRGAATASATGDDGGADDGFGTGDTAGGGGGGGGGGDGIEMRSVAPDSEEGQFQAEVQQNRQMQDKMLEEILVGVNELGDLAGALKSEIDVQGQLINQLDDKIQNTTQGLKTGNAKLQQLLEEVSPNGSLPTFDQQF
jgi:hypothetical protein